MILTRLLSPHELGIVGIIAAVFYAVTMITDLGFEAFLVRHERTDDAGLGRQAARLRRARGVPAASGQSWPRRHLGSTALRP